MYIDKALKQVYGLSATWLHKGQGKLTGEKMKLSNAQKYLLNWAKAKIDKARSMDYPTWLRADQHVFQYNEEAWKKAVEEEYLKEYWERARDAVVLMSCNNRTLHKLQEFGLIEIIDDSTGKRYGIDTIKVLNY